MPNTEDTYICKMSVKDKDDNIGVLKLRKQFKPVDIR
jgi:hypothetical protein